MVTLAWGNFLAIVLPGVLVIFAMRRLVPPLNALLADPNKMEVPAAIFLLMMAGLAGGVLEAIRRLTVDLLFCVMSGGKATIRTSTSGPTMYDYITPENLAVFDSLVENSYRYYAFYGNLFWALMLLVGMRMCRELSGPLDVVLVTAAGVVIVAAWVQYGFFSDAMTGFVRSEKARREEVTRDAKPS